MVPVGRFVSSYNSYTLSEMQRNSTFQFVSYNIQQKMSLIYYYTIIEMVLKRLKIQQRNKVICLVFVSPEWKILQNGLEALVSTIKVEHLEMDFQNAQQCWTHTTFN